MNVYRCSWCGVLWQDVRRGLGKVESAPPDVIAHHVAPYGHIHATPPPEPEPLRIETRECWRCRGRREAYLWAGK